MAALRKTFSAVLLFLIPTFLVRHLLNVFGHRIHENVRIGFSWIWCDLIALERGVRIGHLNLIIARRILLRERAYFGRWNVVKGPIDVILSKRASLGSSIKVLRGPIGVSSGAAQLWLGELAKLTALHRVDCTQTVRIGAYSTVAGAASQIWTHGYVHALEGQGRYRIDGRVDIKNNVYIGSACLISMGVRIGSGVIVGGGTTVASSIEEPGLYVSGALRALPRPSPPESRFDLAPAEDPRLIERVFVKQRG